MKFQKQIKNIFATLFLINLVHAQNQHEELILVPGPVTAKYKKNDLNETYDESSIEIQCIDTKCNTSSDNVLLDEGKITISNSGTYILGGDLNGQLNIAANQDDTIHLVLRNFTLTSNFGPAIYGEKCKKVIITTEGQNTISDSMNYPKDINIIDEVETDSITIDSFATDTVDDDEVNTDETENKNKQPNACIYIKSNLTFNGKGTLDINANFDEGIRTKKNLKVVSGKINITAKGNGIKAKESFSIKDGEINIDSGNIGIKITKHTDPEEGYVVIDGGKITINAPESGIQSITHLTINDGLIDVKGCKVGLEGQMIDISGGEIYTIAKEDAISALKYNNTERNINNAFDEQVYLRVTGGKIDVSVDGPENDGLDTTGSMYIGGTSEIYIGVVYGGTFGGMGGLDSDGYKSVEASAKLFITSSGNFPLEGVAEVREDGIKGTTGREELSVEDIMKIYPERTREKAEEIHELTKKIRESGQKFVYDRPETCTVKQPYIRVILDEIQLGGIPITITDSKGNVVIERTPITQFAIVFYTSPDMIEGETYTVSAGKYTSSQAAKVDNKK
ncbi:hypothetical protein BCR32DRAFT_294529 [Anaeromyces robustus]|uniref:Adhesin domain-containing protein n=1 Tax=Anaeromyces robustus TaxID=1754192 RepID=A0A1Y1X0R6_9FUNG|nr:hypothetical protein BCR32DRAFT_294529 [Anaeromyces robustus]|eukprot:ORX79302.1 hypothetical protein BCR32DRAFT_294529 [Anaeromyces robustus]